MEYIIIRSKRKTLALQVRRDGSIVVRAPFYTTEREIRLFVQKHIDWIRKQLNKLEKGTASETDLPALSEQELMAMKAAAKKDFKERASRFAPAVGVSFNRITIRSQKTKWGSCSSKGNLNFNCLLMLAPETVRDYVTVHELCHLKHMDHSPAFWKEVERVFPDYQKAKKWLRTNGGSIMSRNDT